MKIEIDYNSDTISIDERKIFDLSDYTYAQNRQISDLIIDLLDSIEMSVILDARQYLNITLEIVNEDLRKTIGEW